MSTDPGVPSRTPVHGDATARWTRARRAPLSAGAIVRSALAIADADGLEAVSMRRVATELGVGTMSLYHHVADKDELVGRMSDAVVGELLVPGELPGHWREALRAIAHRTYDAFRRHPWLVESAGIRPVATPTSCATSSSPSPRSTTSTSTSAPRRPWSWRPTTTRSATCAGGSRSARRGRSRRPASARVRELLAAGEFPFLARVLAERPHLRAPEDTFDLGLEWLLDGMAAALGE